MKKKAFKKWIYLILKHIFVQYMFFKYIRIFICDNTAKTNIFKHSFVKNVIKQIYSDIHLWVFCTNEYIRIFICHRKTTFATHWRGRPHWWRMLHQLASPLCTLYTWHDMTCDMWNVTHNMWHVKCDSAPQLLRIGIDSVLKILNKMIT